MREDKRELAHAVRCQLTGIQVLDDEHAVAHVQGLRDLERTRGSSAGTRP
jgi:hypothetical protein